VSSTVARTIRTFEEATAVGKAAQVLAWQPSEPRRSIGIVVRWLIVSWAANAVVLGLTGWLLGGVTFHGSFWTVVFAAAVFGVLNTILKPVLKLLTFPLAIITLGIAWFFVSLFMLWLTVIIVPKFSIDGFWNYVWATIIIWALNIVVDALVGRGESAAAALSAA
jgi:putative membrane protein